LNLPRVHFTGRLTDESLATHLAQAVLHVHPSSFEGFALPSLEALSLGCPTVVADIPLMREVLPEQGVFFFKNGDANGMIEAIEQVLASGDQARTAARRGGELARMKHDWNQVGQATLDSLCLAQAQKK
jgi:glycosyltransferase involved in cell wall biosynthesis